MMTCQPYLAPPGNPSNPYTGAMTNPPNFFGRLWARIQGEVSANTLEAYRRAGDAVYKLLDRAESHRLEHKVKGDNPWQVDPAHQAFFLASWNAFMLQTLGDKLLEADYKAEPATVGYLPRVTAEQAMAFYAQVEPWLSRANQAQSNPKYKLDCAVPTELPAWVEAEPCPKPHLQAMLAATRTAHTHAEAALKVFEESDRPEERRPDLQKLHQTLGEANSKADYAQGFLGGAMTPEVHEAVEQHLKVALEGYYRLGQWLAMPGLLQPQPSSKRKSAKALKAGALPGQAGFDPWALTDPRSVRLWKRDPKARQAIEFMWANDPDPAQTLAIQREIEQALIYGEIEHAGIGHYYCCPWAAVFNVKRPLTLGGVRLEPRQQFTYDVSAEEVSEGGAFKREIMIGNFQPTNQLDYCDPRQGGHED